MVQRRPRRFSLAVLVTGLLGFTGRPARAGAGEGESSDAGEHRESHGSSYWSEGSARAFVSSRLEAGLYVKPQVAVGYGKPYWTWVGAEAYPMTTMSFAAVYAGVHAALPFLDFRAGIRETYSYYRSLLPEKDHYLASDVDAPAGERLHYGTGELELAVVAPVPLGYALGATTFYATLDAPRGSYLYEESLRGVMKAPVIWGNRLGYVLALGKDEFVKAGVLGEIITLPGRGLPIVRAGPAFDVTLTDHLELQATLSMVLSGPDSLGIWDGPFGVLGLSYKWATGDPHPAFP